MKFREEFNESEKALKDVDVLYGIIDSAIKKTNTIIKRYKGEDVAASAKDLKSKLEEIMSDVDEMSLEADHV